MRNHFLRAGGTAGSAINQDPYISGKLFYYKAVDQHDDGGFGAFWVRSNGLIEEDVEINPSGISAFNERTSTIQTDEDVTNNPWKSFEIDLSGVTSPGRIVFYARRDASQDFKTDFALDDIKLHAENGTEVSFDPSSSSVRTNNLWQRHDGHLTTILNYGTAKSQHPATSDWENVDSNPSGGLWGWKQGPTASDETGPDRAANDVSTTYYVYWEGSSSGSNGFTAGGGSYLRWKDQYNLATGATD